MMFQDYCAACHGSRGEGNGPAAIALKRPPTDLTQLARKNNGTFPQQNVQEVLRHGVAVPAHGSSDMPIWGRTLRALTGSDEAATRRIADLTDFVRTLQK